MRRPAYQRRNEMLDSGPMTPMIDVVFLLLVFFVCAAARQVREFLLPADLPAGSIASTQPAAEKPLLGEVWVTLRQSPGGVPEAELNGTVYQDFAQLQTQLRDLAELAPEIPVILDIGQDVEFGETIHLYDTCRAANFESIQFAVDLK